MLNKYARAFFSAIFRPIAQLLLRLGISPDVVTIVGTVGVAFGALWFYPRGDFLVGTLFITVFVFSDMQFDEARDSSQGSVWDTTHDGAARAFADAGYTLPEIVYWNLAAGPGTHPVTADRAGVALVSGFSPAMLKVFMGEPDEAEDFEMVDADPVQRTQVQLDPVSVMMKAVSKASFDGLVVVD